MLERRNSAADTRNFGNVNVRRENTGIRSGFGNDLPPWRHHEAVTEGLAPALMAPALGCGDDIAAILNGPGTQQHMPVRLAGRHREGCRYIQNLSATLRQRPSYL